MSFLTNAEADKGSILSCLRLRCKFLLNLCLAKAAFTSGELRVRSRRYSLWDHLPRAEKELVQEFIGAFPAAEFELKERGFLRRGSDDAQADWDSFAGTIQQRFRVDRPPALAKAWRVLTTSPPRKQVIRNGRLAWKESPRPAGVSDAAWGLLLVRRVRNNLFHGAKFILGGSDDFVRDRDLIRAALVVLDAALSVLSRRRGAA